MKVDIVVRPRIKGAVNADGGDLSAKRFLLALVLEHDERHVGNKSDVRPIVWCFNGLHSSQGAYSLAKTCDFACGHLSEVENKGRCARFFVPRQQLLLSKTDLMSEEGNRDQRQRNRHHRQR